MKTILAAAAYGFAKGFAMARVSPRVSAGGGPNWVSHYLLGPLREEAFYRAAPLSFGDLGLEGWTAVPFALEHVVQESARGTHDAATGFGRFADVMLGGVLYEKAYRQYGLLGAVVAHSLHNIFTGVGARAARVNHKVRNPRQR